MAPLSDRLGFARRGALAAAGGGRRPRLRAGAGPLRPGRNRRGSNRFARRHPGVDRRHPRGAGLALGRARRGQATRRRGRIPWGGRADFGGGGGQASARAPRRAASARIGSAHRHAPGAGAGQSAARARRLARGGRGAALADRRPVRRASALRAAKSARARRTIAGDHRDQRSRPDFSRRRRRPRSRAARGRRLLCRQRNLAAARRRLPALARGRGGAGSAHRRSRADLARPLSARESACAVAADQACRGRAPLAGSLEPVGGLALPRLAGARRRSPGGSRQSSAR